MDVGFCPRCGTKRPDAFEWCRKCGLNFEKHAKGELPGLTRDLAQPPSTPSSPSQPHQVDVRPVLDRQTMARWTRDAMDVRCGGTAGGCLGMIGGFLAGGTIGAAIGGVAPLFTLPIGIVAGMYLGMRLAIGRMAK